MWNSTCKDYSNPFGFHASHGFLLIELYNNWTQNWTYFNCTCTPRETLYSHETLNSPLTICESPTVTRPDGQLARNHKWTLSHTLKLAKVTFRISQESIIVKSNVQAQARIHQNSTREHEVHNLNWVLHHILARHKLHTDWLPSGHLSTSNRQSLVWLNSD